MAIYDDLQEATVVIGTAGLNGTGLTEGQLGDITTRVSALEAIVLPPLGVLIRNAYYGPLSTLSGYTISNINVGANFMWASPFICPQNMTFDQIGVEVTTAAAAGGTIRFGIYNVAPNGLPNTLVTELGTVDTTLTGFRPSPAISLTLSRGLYWIAGAANDADVTIRQLHGSGMTAIGGHSGTAGVSPISAVGRALTAGFTALPASFSATHAGVYVPAFQLHIPL
jgi:hypothetical protein